MDKIEISNKTKKMLEEHGNNYDEIIQRLANLDNYFGNFERSANEIKRSLMEIFRASLKEKAEADAIKTYEDLMGLIDRLHEDILMGRLAKPSSNMNFLFLESGKETIDAEDFVKRHFEDRGYVVQKTNPLLIKGIPDFIITSKKTNESIYVEVKTGFDGLNVNQAQWFASHPNNNKILCFVRCDNGT